MEKSVLEKYYQKGWLKKGNTNLSAEERLYAGYVFYKSYVKSHVLSVGVIDFEKPAVDGGVLFNSVESKIGLRDYFLRAYETVPKNLRPLLEIVILKNQPLEVPKNDLPLFKAMLCGGLDALAIFYMKEAGYAK